MDRMSAFGAGGACGWEVVEDPNTSTKVGAVTNMSVRATAYGVDQGKRGLSYASMSSPLPLLLDNLCSFSPEKQS